MPKTVNYCLNRLIVFAWANKSVTGTKPPLVRRPINHSNLSRAMRISKQNNQTLIHLHSLGHHEISLPGNQWILNFISPLCSHSIRFSWPNYRSSQMDDASTTTTENSQVKHRSFHQQSDKVKFNETHKESGVCERNFWAAKQETFYFVSIPSRLRLVIDLE